MGKFLVIFANTPPLLPHEHENHDCPACIFILIYFLLREGFVDFGLKTFKALLGDAFCGLLS